MTKYVGWVAEKEVRKQILHDAHQDIRMQLLRNGEKLLVYEK